MFQPSSPEPRPEPVQPVPDHETVIRFVISGPFLNAEARTGSEQPAHTPADVDLKTLLGRISELEHELRDERARVDALCKALTAGNPREATAPEPGPLAIAAFEPKPEPAPEPAVAPVAFNVTPLASPVSELRAPVAAVPVAAPPPVPASVPPAPPTPLSIAPVVERTRAHTNYDASEPAAPPKLHALSTAAPPPPPKVRGLRRMIGALRHL